MRAATLIYTGISAATAAIAAGIGQIPRRFDCRLHRAHRCIHDRRLCLRLYLCRALVSTAVSSTTSSRRGFCETVGSQFVTVERPSHWICTTCENTAAQTGERPVPGFFWEWYIEGIDEVQKRARMLLGAEDILDISREVRRLLRGRPCQREREKKGRTKEGKKEGGSTIRYNEIKDVNEDVNGLLKNEHQCHTHI